MSAPSKRPRHSGSFSPASPPYHQMNQTKPVVENPQTPISPPNMASSTQPYVSTSNSINTVTSSFTPATSASGISFLAKDSEGDALMTEEPEVHSEGEESGSEGADMDNEMSDSEQPQKRRRTDHDWHTREPTARPEAILARLNADMGQLYKLCEKPPVMARPHPSQNLMSLYQLNDIAKSVRRVDPTTGEKINKIRKSYEGKVKSLGVAGRNKAVSTPGQWLPHLIVVPEEDYRATRVIGKEIEKGLSEDFLTKLTRAVQMAPGKLPDRESDKWKSLIGTEESQPQVKVKAGLDGRPKAGPIQAATAAGTVRSSSSPAASKLARPERTGTKRRYNDSSFKGYGEGFLDDEEISDEDARSTTSGGIKKKRRKEYSITSPLGQQATNYGVGLVAGGPRR